MSVLSADTEQKVENFLVKKSGINPTQLNALKVKSNQDNVPFITLLINQKLITEENLTEAIASANTIPYVNLSEATISAQTLDLLPKDIAERFMAVPLGEIGNRLAVAMLDADNIQAVDFLASRVNRPVKVYLASEGGIKHIFKQYDAQINKSLIGDFSSSERKNNEASGGIDLESMDVQNISQDSPISKIITSILMFAARNKASDVHIEPTKDFMKIRCRIDGILREVTRLPKIAEPPLISRIKILSNLKIDEHRIPQDGQFSIKAGNKDIDLRIAISPTIWLSLIHI